jgi:hypothetical protein
MCIEAQAPRYHVGLNGEVENSKEERERAIPYARGNFFRNFKGYETNKPID